MGSISNSKSRWLGSDGKPEAATGRRVDGRNIRRAGSVPNERPEGAGRAGRGAVRGRLGGPGGHHGIGRRGAASVGLRAGTAAGCRFRGTPRWRRGERHGAGDAGAARGAVHGVGGAGERAGAEQGRGEEVLRARGNPDAAMDGRARGGAGGGGRADHFDARVAVCREAGAGGVIHRGDDCEAAGSSGRGAGPGISVRVGGARGGVHYGHRDNGAGAGERRSSGAAFDRDCAEERVLRLRGEVHARGDGRDHPRPHCGGAGGAGARADAGDAPARGVPRHVSGGHDRGAG